MAAIGKVPPLPILRRELLSSEQIEQMSEVQSFFQRLNIQTKQDRIDLINDFYPGHIPKEHPNANGLAEEQEEELISLLSKVHQSLCQQELMEKIESALQISDKEDKRHLFEKIHFFYPWSIIVYKELSIFYDQAGELQQAWEYILTAMLLSLDNPSVWQSFAMIMHRSGNANDAKLSIAMQHYLQEHKNT